MPDIIIHRQNIIIKKCNVVVKNCLYTGVRLCFYVYWQDLIPLNT